MNARRRPTMSPSRAPVTTSEPNAIVYTAMISCSSALSACRLCWSDGAATTRIAASIDAIACPASRITIGNIGCHPARPTPRRLEHSCSDAAGVGGRGGRGCDNPAMIDRRAVLHCDGVTISDVACRHGAGRGEGPEPSPARAIVFVRRGCFVRSADGIEAVLDPTVAYCTNPGEEQRYDHPQEHGDDCTVIALDAASAERLWGDAPLPAGPLYTTPAIDLEHRLLLAAAPPAPGSP